MSGKIHFKVLPGCFFMLIVAFILNASAAAGIVVVVAADSEVPTLMQAEVRAIFLAKRRTIGDGIRIKAVYQLLSQPIYLAFNLAVLRKNNKKLKRHWARLIFSGRGKLLRYMKDNQAVKHFVNSTEGGIGYIDKNAVDASVKVVFEVENDIN